MNRTGPFGSLNFVARQSRIAGRVLTLAAAFIIFSLLWLVIPGGALYWLLLPLVLALTWAASYGWRPAVASLIQFLRFLLER